MPIYLKSIELAGFKSFPVKTHIEFTDGITGIVGPNGSGKSNVVEAIKWVLGEQSAKSLRGDKMEDVIFAGTRDRSAMGMADVNLIFNNENHWLGLDYTEVSISRRISRSGEGQYYINRSRSRLKDVVELFLDTGVGKDSYAIFEQGKIDRLLSESPVERRSLFEDFAGISKFKFRKDEAEKKLENSRLNLERVNDIVIELDKEVVKLKAQAEDANRYQELRNQLRDLEIQFESLRVRNLKQEIEKRVEKKKGFQEKLEPFYAQSREKEDAILVTDEDISNREKEFNNLNDSLNNMEREFAELRSRLSGNQEQKQSLIKQQESMKTRLQTEEARLANLYEEMAEKEKEMTGISEKKNQSEAELNRITDQINEIYTNMKLLDERILQKSRELGFNRIISKDDIEKVRQELITHQATMTNIRSTIEEKLGTLRGLESEKREQTDYLQNLQNEINTIKHQLDEIVKAIDANLQQEKQIREENKQHNQEIKNLQVELKSMDRIIMESLEKQSAELKTFTAKKPLLEAKIEGALEKISDYLNNNRPPEETKKVIEDLRHLFQDYRGYYENILGILYSDEGTYTRKENIQNRIEELTETIYANENRLEELRAKLRELQGVRADLSNSYNRTEYDVNSTKNDISKLDKQLNDLQENLKYMENQINNLSESIKSKQQHIEIMTDIVQNYETEVAEMRDQRGKLQSVQSEKKIDFARVEEQYKSLKNELNRITHQIRDIQRMKESYASDTEANRVKIEDLDARIAQDDARMKELDELRKKTRSQTDKQRKDIQDLRNNRKNLENQIKELSMNIHRIEQSVSDLDLSISEKQGTLDATLENVLNTYNVDIGDYPVDEEANLTDISAMTKEVRRELSRLGEVNMLAIEQYQEAEERMRYLQEQKADIERAMEDILALIDETNSKSIEQFDRAFQDIRRAFKKVFARLFDGGRADLILVNKDDPLGSGIDIMAEPPGKKFQNINLLSGGERALVAIAVIFAILYLKPTPFVVLDELDAPLDDDNIDRFKNIVHEFKQTCQFILVSHSKSTLEICDSLYGVTMEEQGVSKIVNVAFDEADILFKKIEDGTE